jgi:hypothetical protein
MAASRTAMERKARAIIRPHLIMAVLDTAVFFLAATKDARIRSGHDERMRSHGGTRIAE